MSPTAHVRRVYERQAAHYDTVIGIAEQLLFSGGREWACQQARGRVLEVGIGTGRNLSWYSPEVELIGVDLSPAMLERARARAARVGRAVDLREGDAQALQLPDACVDTVVATLTLCSIPDHVAAVAEMARVLRPGGRLVLLDHVGSPVRVVRAVQRLLDPLAVRLAADHLLRDPQDAVRRAGLVVDQLQRSKLGIVARVVAHRPEPLEAPGCLAPPRSAPTDRKNP